MNLAARLTDEADAGEILVSDLVWRALGSKLECTDAGALTVKGYASPVRAYRLHGFRQVAEGSTRRLSGAGKSYSNSRPRFRAAAKPIRAARSIFVARPGSARRG